MQEVKKTEAANQRVDGTCQESVPGTRADWHRYSLVTNLLGSNGLCCSLKGNWGVEPTEIDFILIISTNIHLGASHSAGLIPISSQS